MPKQTGKKLNAGQVKKEIRELRQDKPRRERVARSLRDKGLLDTLEEVFDVDDEQRSELQRLPPKGRDSVARVCALVLENGGEIEFRTGPPESIKLELKGEISTNSNGEEEYKATVTASTSIC